MFERRLKILLIVLSVPAAAIVLRLVQLQVLEGESYAAAGKRMLARPPQYFPCLRGEIHDHEGRRLAYDAPAWDICVRYEALSGDSESLRLMARRMRLTATPAREQIDAGWQSIARLTETPIEELDDQAEVIRRRVRRIKQIVSNRRGIETPIEEEERAHAVVSGLDQNQQAVARVELAGYPWIEVVGAHARRYDGGESVGHLLGYLNEVSAADLEADPRRDDDLARYRDGDRRGIAGIEALGEQILRGRRGRRTERDTGVESIDPVEGGTFRLTIDLPLQQAVYERLAAAVKGIESATGGSAVILDVPSRQVLALVSYPGYDPNVTHAERVRLDADSKYRPLAFRAVAETYPPGSIAKPIVLAGALTSGIVTEGSSFTCSGQLFSGVADRWRCLGHHGDVSAVAAIQRSCNIYFYHVGQAMGVPNLASWMTHAGFDRPSGTGLIEEARGMLPRTDEPGPGDARNTAIGQGNVAVTPIQAANMIATIASGVYRPVTLWADDPQPRPAVPLTASRDALRAVRLGMYRAANEEHGTAYNHIHLTNTGDLVLLGKTGSAETGQGRVVEWIFDCRYADGSLDELVAANKTDLFLRYPRTRRAVEIKARSYQEFPTREMDPTHAWFAGYLTPQSRYLESSSGGRLNVAFAVLIEFGGRGGAVAAPVAGEIVQAMIDMQAHAGGPQ